MADLINYQIKCANEDDIYSHLLSCADTFIPPLETSVDIKAYAKKIFENAVTFEAWTDKKLVGLVAAYLNDQTKLKAFITNVSIMSEYRGKGIALELLSRCVTLSKNKLFSEILLEVAADNKSAIQLYLKQGFTQQSETAGRILMTYKLN